MYDIAFMRIKTLLLLSALSVATMPRTAEACVCANQNLNDREEAAAQFKAATFVFEGEVLAGGHEISTSKDKPGLSVIPFRVLRSYKGNPGESVQIYDAMAGTDCSSEPSPRAKYFVYGFKGEDDKVYIQACSRTTTLEWAGADIRFARGEPATKEDLAPPGERSKLYRDPTLEKRGASIKGVVYRSNGDDASKSFVTVWDVDEDGRRNRAGSMAATQKVKEDGSFEIRFLAPGQYNVTAADMWESPTARYVGEYGNVVLAERQVVSHVGVQLHAEPLGSVRVRVIAPEELRDRIVVLLRDVEMDASDISPYPYSQTASLKDESTASFESVPRGRYNVYAMLTGEDVSRPSWTHDEVQVQLNGNRAEAMVTLRKSQ